MGLMMVDPVKPDPIASLRQDILPAAGAGADGNAAGGICRGIQLARVASRGGLSVTGRGRPYGRTATARRIGPSQHVPLALGGGVGMRCGRGASTAFTCRGKKSKTNLQFVGRSQIQPEF